MADKKTKKIINEDNDFADSVKPKEVEKTETVEAKKEINFYKTTSCPELDKNVPPLEEVLLKELESSRENFLKIYKKSNGTKSLINLGIFTFLLAGWIVPGMFISNGTISFIVSIIVSAICIVGVSLLSKSSRKESEEEMKKYFREYYSKSSAYGFSQSGIENFDGDLDKKLDENEFKNNGMFKDIFKIGSRYFSTFKYKKMDCAVCDCAAQIKLKDLQTVFVGKYLIGPNNYKGDGLYVYFKGNSSRALPPNRLKDLNLIKETDKYLIFSENEKHIVPKSLIDIIGTIETNTILVDAFISIKPGKTYIGLGYEDTLMIIPLQNRIDPRPFDQFKKDMPKMLGILKIIEEMK